MLAYYTGARREELCGLAPDDLIEVDGRFVLRIRPNAIRSLKNDQSNRHVVLHPELVRLGFPAYVESIRALGYTMVFPELALSGGKGSCGDRLYDELEVAFKKTGFSTHHLRHAFNDNLKQADVSEEIRADLMGYGGTSETTERYVRAAKHELQASKIALLDVVTDHLSARELMLLP